MAISFLSLQPLLKATTSLRKARPMLSSLEIAQAAVMRPIADVAAEVGIEPDEPPTTSKVVRPV